MGGQPMTEASTGAAKGANLDGLRRGFGRDGTPIPAYQTLGVEVRSAKIGAAVVRVPVSPYLTGPDGDLLPGAFAVLADACCGCAIAAAMPGGGAALTAQLRVEFIRPLPAGHTWIEGRAEADAVDNETGLARAEIVDEADQLLGVASLRVMKSVMTAASQRQLEAVAALAQPAVSGRPAESPAARLVGVASRLADSGQSAWTFRPPAGAANSYGMVHGGVLGLLAHEVASDALRSVIGPEEELLPLDLVLNYYRGVPVSAGLAAATARVTHRGRRFIVAEGEVISPEGRCALRLSAGAQVRPKGDADD
jgi:uncharacterized protein (TIGR00369 family)